MILHWCMMKGCMSNFVECIQGPKILQQLVFPGRWMGDISYRHEWNQQLHAVLIISSDMYKIITHYSITMVRPSHPSSTAYSISQRWTLLPNKYCSQTTGTVIHFYALRLSFPQSGFAWTLIWDHLLYGTSQHILVQTFHNFMKMSIPLKIPWSRLLFRGTSLKTLQQIIDKSTLQVTLLAA